jgi:copper(I)-binding protein
MFMLSLIRFVLLSVLLLAGNTVFAGNDVVVQNPWVREAPPTASMLAGYMVLENQSGETRALVSASSSQFHMVEIHRTEIKEGVARMTHQDKVEIKAGKKVEFKPGGYHLMLMHPEKALHAGDEVKITLEFADGTKLPIVAPVKKGGDHSHHEMHEHEHMHDMH